MKIIVFVLIAAFLFTFSASDVFAQYRKLTVILLRHAEKDTSEEADEMNPDLTAAGNERARRLIDAVDKYQPDAIYSTQYIRTMETARPLARKNREMIQLYDEQNLEQMRALILSGKVKRLVVVGHNNTTPALVNMLLKEDKYKKLGDNEYDKIWVVKIRTYKRKPAKVSEKVITY